MIANEENSSNSKKPALTACSSQTDFSAPATCLTKRPLKRVRRRERKKKQPHGSLSFSIKAVKCQTSCVYFRNRNPNQRSINLHSFYNQHIPYVCVTQLHGKIMASQGNNMVNTQVHRYATQNEVNSGSKSVVIQKKIHFERRGKTPQKAKGNYVREEFKPYLNYNDVNFGIECGRLVVGNIRINPKSYQEAYVSNTNRSIEDYLICSIVDRNRALEGDLVVLEIKPESEWKGNYKTAAVVYIKEKVKTK